VRALDEALLAACDRAVEAVERAVSRARRQTVRAHARGRLLSALAIAMVSGACDHDTLPIGDTINDSGVGAPIDASTDASAPVADLARDLTVRDLYGSCEQDYVNSGELCARCGTYDGSIYATMNVTFDAAGRATSVTGDGYVLTKALADCYLTYLSMYCYPSLASSTHKVTAYCFIA
jgi:hypothetical protein